MDEKIECIEKNQTWELVGVPKDKNVISVKWIYKTKHKEILLARGLTQQSGTDFNETFVHVAQKDTVRTILAIATQNKCHVYQMDFKYAFLTGYLKEEVYVEQPQGKFQDKSTKYTG